MGRWQALRVFRLMVHNVSLLAADTPRARAYLSLLGEAGLLPENAILVETNGIAASQSWARTNRFDNTTPLAKALARAGVPYINVRVDSLNDAAVVSEVARLDQNIVIFAGPAGTIVRRPLFETGKTFLHVHPGRLPAFRGSTPMYYSLLSERRLAATAIILAEEIDAGQIVREKFFEPPPDLTELDHSFDPWMRGSLLTDVLRDYAKRGALPECGKSDAEGEVFFVIHPVLKHIAVLQGDDRRMQRSGLLEKK